MTGKGLDLDLDFLEIHVFTLLKRSKNIVVVFNSKCTVSL